MKLAYAGISFSTTLPYQTRRAYVRMIERLTKRIHEIDPNRPVLAALEHGKNLVGTLQDFRNLAPSLDMVGVNTYYGSQIEELDSLFRMFDPGRPYLVSAFGPEKYWGPGLLNLIILPFPMKILVMRKRNYTVKTGRITLSQIKGVM